MQVLEWSWTWGRLTERKSVKMKNSIINADSTQFFRWVQQCLSAAAVFSCPSLNNFNSGGVVLSRTNLLHDGITVAPPVWKVFCLHCPISHKAGIRLINFPYGCVVEALFIQRAVVCHIAVTKLADQWDVSKSMQCFTTGLPNGVFVSCYGHLCEIKIGRALL